jgi:transcriptional regulator with XRE-family HTH domain
VATRTNPRHEAAQLTRWQLMEVGREFRVARLASGKTLLVVGTAAGTSPARISRVERGMVPSVTVRELARIGSVVGQKLYIRVYPAIRRLLDGPQLELFSQLRNRAHLKWHWETEVPMPIAGDLRAGDARSSIPGCTVLWELWTRLADFQAQTRGARLKQRDLGADRLVIVLKATRANRSALREAGPAVRETFQLDTRHILRALAEGRDPGANGILLL